MPLKRSAPFLILPSPAQGGALPSPKITESQGKIIPVGKGKRIVLRTTHWLCTDPVFGIKGSDPNAMPILVQRIHATDIVIHYRGDSIKDWQWNRLVATVSYWLTKGLRVWIESGKTTLAEPDGTPYSIKYVIDNLGKISGVIIDLVNPVDPSDATNWLLEKHQQLAEHNMDCGFYYGDGLAPNQGNGGEKANATYLTEQGLILMAWLRQVGAHASWKPGTFNLQRFWVDYDILTALQSGGPEGQSSEEIYNQWYLKSVIEKYSLRNNNGCEALVFGVYMNFSWPTIDAIKGLVAVSDKWLGI
jgi:hypothetical protein